MDSAVTHKTKFLPLGKEIFLKPSSFDKSVKVWDLRNNACVDNITSNINSPIVSVAFSCDGKKILSGAENGTLSVLSS